MARKPLQAGLYRCGVIAVILTALTAPLAAQTISRLPPVESHEVVRASHFSIDAVRTASAHAPRADAEKMPEADGNPESIPVPRPLEFCPAGGQPDDFNSGDTRLIDLPMALRLADRINPEIGISRQAILESLAFQQQARVLLLPTITGGTNYHLHNGNLQRPDGSILGLSEQSLYFGGGAQAIGTQTIAYPAIRVFAHLGDAFFEPLAARQQMAVRQFDAGATFNSTLLNVSTGYLGLMAAEAQLEVLRQSQADALEVVRITTNFARAGQGRQADADRVATEATLIASQIQRAQEGVAVASADLTRLLSLDPSTRLKTVAGPIPVLLLVDPKCGLDQLLAVALRQRPEIAARNARIAEMQTRSRQERTRPWLPTISVGFSAGDFGGGSNFTNPTFGNFGARTDFDAIAFWTAQNLGAGNVARWNGRRAQTDEAVADRVRTVNAVRSEVAEAYAQVTAGRREIDVQVARLAVAEAGFREEFGRIRGGEGLPIELLDNLTRLVSARQAIVAAIAAYDQAQFRLFVALGQPPTLALPNAQKLDAPGGK